MLKYSHPVLAVFVQHWPVMIFLPVILLMVAALALITHWWDERDLAANPNRAPSH